MLIESDPHQTRIAVLEDDRLTEIFVERHRHRGLVGNVYKGRVTRVLPGMQAAFVDVGLERDAFLYVSDVASDVESMDELEIDEPRTEEPASPHGAPSIDELLKPGQEIIVQVVKDPLPSKGARISTHVTLPGRYLVLLPTVKHFGVSRRIEDETERDERGPGDLQGRREHDDAHRRDDAPAHGSHERAEQPQRARPDLPRLGLREVVALFARDA